MAWPFGSTARTAPEPAEQRSISFGDVFGSSPSAVMGTGVESALRLVPLYAATRLIADQFASAPLHAYREMAGVKERLEPPPQLVGDPSPLGQTVFTWKYQAITSALLRGFALGLISSVDDLGHAAQVEWLHPDLCSIDDSDPRNPVFRYSGRKLNRASIVYVPAYIIAGTWKGLSPISAFRVAMETGQAAQQATQDWFRNGATPSSHLKNSTQTLSAEDAEKAKIRYKASVANQDVLVTGRDWDLTTIGVSASDAQFVETLKLTATQIASIYGVPPEMIGGESGASMTYANVEQQGIDLLKYTLRPWFVRFEEAFTREMARGQYAKFNVDAIIRADLKTRMESHKIALSTGVETQDEARRIEDRAPLTDEQRAEWAATYGKGAA